MEIKIRRVYEESSAEDGKRILVDRLWPRGVSREKADVDEWFKEVAPSDALRKWYDHDPKKFFEFKKRYVAELTAGKAFEELLNYLRSQPKATLLFAAKEAELSNAAVLEEMIRKHQSK